MSVKKTTKSSKEQNLAICDSSNKSSEVQNPAIYDSSKAICKLIFIGIAVLVGCVVVGILITQAIGWLVEWLIGYVPDEIEPGLHFVDFLGGAIGLSVGFVFDKICLERINCVYAFRRFMSALRHELNNIQCKTGDKSHIYIKRKDKIEDVEFGKDGEVLTKNLAECKGVFDPVKELILDNIVTSAETMSLISNLPFAGDFKNQFTDFLGRVHKRIGDYNKSLEVLDEEVKEKKVVIEESHRKLILAKRRGINEEIDNFKADEKFRKLTVER